PSAGCVRGIASRLREPAVPLPYRGLRDRKRYALQNGATVLSEFQFRLHPADPHCFTEVSGPPVRCRLSRALHRRAELRREIPVSAKIDKARRLLALVAAQDFFTAAFRSVSPRLPSVICPYSSFNSQRIHRVDRRGTLGRNDSGNGGG